MRHIDEARLEQDLGYRYRYLVDFIGFTAEDEAVFITQRFIWLRWYPLWWTQCTIS